MPGVDPTPGGPGANASVPQFTLSGPRDPLDCFTAGSSPMQWVLNVTDAGPSALRFVALSHHDDTPGCAATTRNPRARVVIGGVTAYTPHSNGQTTFTFDPREFTCGRVQVDVSIFDADGNEILIVGAVINYGTQCAPPPPGTLVCAPPASNASIGQPVSFTAAGGTGSYTWSAPSGTPAGGSGGSFTTSYGTTGIFLATVASGGQTATCQVTVTGTIAADVACTPANQSVGLGQSATLAAVGGNGSYSWAAPGGSTTTGVGSTFSTSYAAPGAHPVTVTSGTKSATCQVSVSQAPPPEPLVCAPPTQTVAIGQFASVNASGGTGTYEWSAPGGSTSSGTGASFSTSYAGAGGNTITVTSGSQTATCLVTVSEPPPLVCAPPSQNVLTGGTVNVSATGGTGTYAWSAPAGSPMSGAGSSFSTSYSVAGTNTISVTSGSQTATCQVVVSAPTPPVFCHPLTQTIEVNQMTQKGAWGGDGTYTWSAPGSTPASGSGVTFWVQYATTGTKSITVTSGSSSAVCTVDVVPGSVVP